MNAPEHPISPAGQPRCVFCGDVIGVYEPLIRVVEDRAERTSRAADPDIADSAQGAFYHARCYGLS